MFAREQRKFSKLLRNKGIKIPAFARACARNQSNALIGYFRNVYKLLPDWSDLVLIKFPDVYRKLARKRTD